MNRLACICGLAAWFLSPLQAAPAYRQVQAEEVRPREGIGHLLAKIEAGRPITVAYLGGSITAMNGWRNKTTDWLRKTYPKTTFTEINAAIGGTGSDLGVFRLGHDALRHNPDLLFVEFATNDGGAAPEAIWQTMEGIVRQTWKKDPTTDIVFTYTITAAFTNDYCRGVCNRSASAMELLADHYGIPSVGFGPRVARLINEHKLMMDAREIEATVPRETPERNRVVRERIKTDGRLLFADDSVHPRDEGHALYLPSITNAFTRMRDSKPADHRAKLAVPFVPDNFEQAKMVPVSSSMLTGSWQALPEDNALMRSFSNRMGQIWFSEAPGSTLTFSVRGRRVCLYDLLGPDGGQVRVSVDGAPAGKPIPRFDSYCTYHRIATLWVAQFPDDGKTHRITVTVDPEQPDRHPVAFRLKDPEKELKEPKYQGTKFWVSQIMLLGDLVE